MGIIAPQTGLMWVQTYENLEPAGTFYINPGPGVFRIQCYLKCSTVGAGTKTIKASIAHSWKGADAQSAPDILALSDVANNRSDTFLINHDGTQNLQCDVQIIAAGAGDKYDVTWIVEKVYEDFQS